MISPFTVTLPGGRASFESVIRSWDESPQLAFCVELEREPPLYGIWRTKYGPDGNLFDVEIIGFGWASKYNAGNPNPVTRRKFSAAKAANVKAMVVALFEDKEVRNKTFPFASNISGFQGGVTFHADWILFDA